MTGFKRLGGIRAVLALIAVAAVLRVIHIAFMADSPLFLAPTSDAFEHFDVARILAGGDWLGRSIGIYHRPQLFAYFSAAIYKVFGLEFVALHFVQNVLDICAVGLWYLLARRAFPRIAALVGGLFVATHWPFVYFASSGYMESFAMFLNAGFLLALAVTAERAMRGKHGHRCGSDWVPLCLAGLLGGLSALTRPTVLIVMPGIGFALLWLYIRARGFGFRALVPPAIFTAIVVSVVGTNALRHWTMFGVWAPLGSGSELNFHMGNRIDGWGWDVSSPGIEFEVYQNLPIIEGNAEPTIDSIRHWWKARDARFVKEQTGEFVTGLVLKGLRLLNANEIYCTQDYAYSRQKSPVLWLLPGLRIYGPLALSGIVLALASIGFALYRRRLPEHTNFAQWWTRILLLLWIVPYFAGVALYLDISRHRLPLVPPALLLGGWAVWRISWVARNRGVSLVPYLTLVLAMLIVTRLPVVPVEYYAQHERWWTKVNLGVALNALGRPAEAEQAFESAIEVMPDKLEPYRQLANTRSQSGNYEGAVMAQRQLLEKFRFRYPAYYMVEAGIFESLAKMQSLAGLHADAEKTAHKLVALAEYSPAAYVTLAQVYLAAGDRENAISAMEKAVELDPAMAPSLERLRNSP